MTVTAAAARGRATSDEPAETARSRRSSGPCRYLAARPSVQDLERISAGGEPVRVRRHARVFSEGDLLDAVYVIRRGTIALSRAVEDRRVTLLSLREGDILGDIPMMLQAPALFDAVADTDAQLVRIPAGRLLATLDQSPEFARRWMLWLSGRLSHAHTRLLSLLAGDVRAQVAALLAQEACGGDTVRLTHHDIAAMIGAQRSSITRALDELAAVGVVSTGYGRVTVLDYDALTRAARSTVLDEAVPRR